MWVSRHGGLFALAQQSFLLSDTNVCAKPARARAFLKTHSSLFSTWPYFIPFLFLQQQQQQQLGG
jgi:hypothetical protein